MDHVETSGHLELGRLKAVASAHHVKEDGSASLSRSDGGAVFGRWEASGNDNITFYEEEIDTERSGGKRHSVTVYTAFPATYKPDANELLLDAGVLDGEGTLCFSDIIKFMSEQVSAPSSADVTEIKDASALVGDWELFWVMEGDSAAQGQADKLATWKGCKNGTLNLAEGGKGTSWATRWSGGWTAELAR